MRDLFLLASEVQSFCRVRGWRFCFIGGIALQRWGEPRLTGDVDLTILAGFGREADYIEELCGAFAGRIPDAVEFAHRSRVLSPPCIWPSGAGQAQPCSPSMPPAAAIAAISPIPPESVVPSVTLPVVPPALPLAVLLQLLRESGFVRQQVDGIPESRLHRAGRGTLPA